MSNAKAASRTAMRVSAIRFGADLWQMLEAEAARAGVSVSQYVREAALARASAAAAARGEDPLEVLARAVHDAIPVTAQTKPRTRGKDDEPQDDEPLVSSARDIRSQAQETRSDAQAVRAQSQQASRHARHLASKRRSDD